MNEERIEMARARLQELERIEMARARLEDAIVWSWIPSARRGESDAAAAERVVAARARLEETIASAREAARARLAKKIVLVVVQPDPDDPPALAVAVTISNKVSTT